MTAYLIIFLFASGDTRSIYGTESDCKLYRDMLARHELYVDDIDLERQAPVEVKCERKIIGVDVES